MKYFTTFLLNFQNIKKDYFLMVITLFFMKTGQFMLLPFLAIYLAKNSQITPTTIGVIIGIGPFIYGMTGLGAGVVIDRVGVKIVLILSLLIGSISIFFFFYVQNTAWLILMSMLTGLTRAFFDVASKTYGLSGMSNDLKKFSFSFRFMIINSAAAIGPAIGAFFAAINSLFCFTMIGIFYFVLSLASIFMLQNTNKREISVNKAVNLSELINITIHDKHLKILLMASFIIWIIYSQLDSTLPQHLSDSLNNGVKVYSFLLIINGVGCASAQLLISQLIKNLNERLVSYLAMSLFALAYGIMALFVNVPVLVLAAIIIVFAESTIMPLNDYLITCIAPPHRIGTYYGVVGFATLGLGIGPMLGGIIYDQYTAKTLFLICGSLCLMTIFLYKRLINTIMLQEKLQNV